MSEENGKITAKLRSMAREDHLREMLVILFDKMGVEPVLTHGPFEYGKDIGL